MSDFVPSPGGDALLWLHAIRLEPEAEPVALRLESLTDGRPGSDVILAAVTIYRGSANPLARGPRMAVRIEGLGGRPPEVDLGTVIRTMPSDEAADGTSGDGGIVGRGRPRRAGTGDPARPSVVDLSIGQDAIISLDDWDVPATELLTGGPRRDPAGTRSIEVLPAARIPVEVQVVDRTAGEAVPSRVRFTAADGRYLPPVGHRDEINPAFFEDTGGDLILGSAAYAYVPGRFTIELPPGRGRCRGRRRVRPGPRPRTAARRGPLDPPRRARAGPDDRPARRAMGHRRHPRTFPRPVDGPPAGGRRGRRRRQPAGRAVGRPVHEHDRPAMGLDGRSDGPADRRGRDREPPEPARPPGAPRGTPADPPDSRAAARPRAAWPAPWTSCWPTGRTAAAPPAASSWPPTSRCPTRRSRPTSCAGKSTPSRPGARARARRPGRPRVVPLPDLGHRLPIVGRHRQDVGRGPGRRGPGLRPPADDDRSLRHVGGGRPRGSDVRDVRARSSSSSSTAMSRAT